MYGVGHMVLTHGLVAITCIYRKRPVDLFS